MNDELNRLIDEMESLVAEIKRKNDSGNRQEADISRQILRILVHSYEQSAQHTLVLNRDADLRMGNARLSDLTSQAQHDRGLSLSLAKGGILGLGVPVALQLAVFGWTMMADQVAKDQTQPLLLRVISNPGVVMCVSMVTTIIVISLLIGAMKRAGKRIKEDEDRRQLIRRESAILEQTQEEYLLHSEGELRIQRARQRFVRYEALMLTLGGSAKEILKSENAAEGRRLLEKIEVSTRQQAREEDEFECRGGQGWLTMLKFCLRDQYPPYVFTYLIASRDGKASVEEWKGETQQLRTLVARRKNRDSAKEFVEPETIGIDNFSRASFSALLFKAKAESGSDPEPIDFSD
ncbi:MAG: hypothetical protein AAF585_11470, partial [Verrucomicrobiota bacterium]